MPRKFIIGTRGSLLAVSQCELLKTDLESKTGLQFELKKIKTEGDLKTEKPLWQMDGKDFFTKELDQALRAHEVDLVVHSYKDLGSDRPYEFELAAISKRSFGEDILLLKNETIKQLSSINEFIVGTSSPRRIVNIESSLAPFLPKFNGSVKTKMLRGNVNTRIEKMKNGDYHAIVLAMAGLERLASHPTAKTKLKELLDDLNFLILPQRTFPSASSQGALGVEICKSNPDYQELRTALKTIEDEQTVREMKEERKRFASYGGGCHLAVGIQVEETFENGPLLVIEKGVSDNKRVNEEKLLLQESPISQSQTWFVGFPPDALKKMNFSHPNLIGDEIITKKETSNDFNDIKSKNKHLFVTSKYTLNLCEKLKLPEDFVWASGSMTLKRLIDRGIWVNGSADGLGHDKIKNYLSSNLIREFARKASQYILSSDQSQSDWGEVLGAYQRIESAPTPVFIEKFKSCTNFYWTSYPQFEVYTKYFPFLLDKTSDLKHYTGLGKTHKEFIKRDYRVNPILNLSQTLNS